MSQNFQAGDYLIFQVESGFGLLRLLAIEEKDGEKIWHLAAYNEMFLDVEMADMALENHKSLTVSIPQVALTNRAFEATQTARMMNVPPNDSDFQALKDWKNGERKISDLSIRLLLGLR